MQRVGTLRVSGLAVIEAFAIGAELGGVMGALLAPPVAAMYPSIESLWLVDGLGPDVAADHRRVEGEEERWGPESGRSGQGQPVRRIMLP